MYTQIQITNFRGFRDITVGPLQRVNLLVAKNNVGKTAFLEALTLLVNGKGIIQSFPALFRSSNHPEQDSEFWPWLFFDRRLGSIIKIEADKDDHKNKETVLLQATLAKENKNPSGFAHVHNFQVENIQYNLWLRTEPEMNNQNTPKEKNDLNGGVKTFSTSPLNSIDEARKYYKVMLKKDGEEKVQALLRVVEPRLIKIRPALIGNQPSIYADIGLSVQIPITLLGQGFCRLLSIYSSLFLSEAKVFLIDEMENGIHYSALEQVWQGIAEVAEQESVQVFATTHSWECIEAAEKVFSERQPYDFALHRLQIVKDKVEVKTYDKDTLATSIESKLEIR